MRPFQEIFESTIAAHGVAKIESRLVLPKSSESLSQVPDSEYLSLMSRRIFRAGLKHAMVDAKWPAFEQVFYQFEVDRVRMMSDDKLDTLMKDTRIIRHWAKLKSVRSNAQAIFEVSREYAGFGNYIAAWPVQEIVGLWRDLQSRFMQFGGKSAPYFLRMSGKDTFVLTNDVIKALNRWGAYRGVPGGIKAKTVVQDRFNTWQQECKRPLCQISMVLALSVS